MNLVPGFDVDQLLGFGGEEQLGNALAVPKYVKFLVRVVIFIFISFMSKTPCLRESIRRR